MLGKGRQLVQPLPGPQTAQPGTGLRPRRSGRSDGPARMAQPRRSQGCTPPVTTGSPGPLPPCWGGTPGPARGPWGQPSPAHPVTRGSVLLARSCPPHTRLPSARRAPDGETPARAGPQRFPPEGQRGNISGSAAHLGGNYSALLQREGRQRGHGLGPRAEPQGRFFPGSSRAGCGSRSRAPAGQASAASAQAAAGCVRGEAGSRAGARGAV